MLGMTAPVVGSGCCPACTASVSSFIVRELYSEFALRFYVASDAPSRWSPSVGHAETGARRVCRPVVVGSAGLSRRTWMGHIAFGAACERSSIEPDARLAGATFAIELAGHSCGDCAHWVAREDVSSLRRSRGGGAHGHTIAAGGSAHAVGPLKCAIG